jgi:hypothetical protein
VDEDGRRVKQAPPPRRTAQELELPALSYDGTVIAPFTEPAGGGVDARLGHVAAASLTLA